MQESQEEEEVPPSIWITVHVGKKLAKRRVPLSSTVAECISGVCEEFKLNPAMYLLQRKHAGKTTSCYERSSIIGDLGLNVNAQLKLVKAVKFSKASTVHVRVLVHLDNQPITMEAVFPSDTTLFSMLQGLSTKYSKNLVNRSDTNKEPTTYMMPVLAILRREFGDLILLHRTTLGSLGFTSGSVLMRLRFKDSVLTMNEKIAVCSDIEKTSGGRRVIVPEEVHSVEVLQAASEAEMKKKIANMKTTLTDLKIEAGKQFPMLISILHHIQYNLLPKDGPVVHNFRRLNLQKKVLMESIGRFPLALYFLGLSGWRDDHLAQHDEDIIVLLPENEDKTLILVSEKILKDRLADLQAIAYEQQMRDEEDVFYDTYFHPEGEMVQEVEETISEVEEVVEEESDDAGAANLNAEYNISEVRASLTVLKENCQNEDYLKKLKLLRKITTNLIDTTNPQYRQINPVKNAFSILKDTEGSLFTGVKRYLSFLGFQSVDTQNGPRLIIQSEHQIKIKRAYTIINMIIKENTPTEVEVLANQMSPVDPQLAVYDMTVEVKKPLQELIEEDQSIAAADRAIYFAEIKAMQAKSKHENVFVTKSMLEKERMEKKMKYTESVIRIQFSDHILVQVHFSPYATFQSVCDFISNHILRQSVNKQPFALILPPAETLSSRQHAQKRLEELGLVPGGLVRFKFVSGDITFPSAESVLIEELFKKKQKKSEMNNTTVIAKESLSSEQVVKKKELTEEERFQAYLAKKKAKKKKK